MSTATSPAAISSHPQPVDIDTRTTQHYRSQGSPPLSSASSSTSSGSEAEPNIFSVAALHGTRKSRIDRPRMSERQRSSSIIIPKGNDTYQTERPEYPPDDARAMSPRRNSEDLERLELGVRKSLQEYAPLSLCSAITNVFSQARTLQSSLAALASRIDEVRQDHDRLETENRLLQDYIGGLTRTMSKDNLARSSSTRKGKK